MSKKILISSVFILLIAIGAFIASDYLSFILLICSAAFVLQTDEVIKKKAEDALRKKLPELEKNKSMWLAVICFFFAIVFSGNSGKNKSEDIVASSPSQLEAHTTEDNSWLNGVMPTPEIKGEFKNRKVNHEFAQHIKAQSRSLWEQLNGFRYNSEFHRVGFAGDGESYVWEQRRNAIDNLWSQYISQFPHRGNTKYMNIGVTLNYMRTIAMDWRKNKGDDTQFTIDITPEIEESLK